MSNTKAARGLPDLSLTLNAFGPTKEMPGGTCVAGRVGVLTSPDEGTSSRPAAIGGVAPPTVVRPGQEAPAAALAASAIKVSSRTPMRPPAARPAPGPSL